MKRVYGILWTGDNTRLKTLYSTKELAQHVVDKKNDEVHWFRKKFFSMRYVVCAYKLIEE